MKARLGILCSIGFVSVLGCSSVCHHEEKISEVAERQSQILKKLIDLRSTDDFKQRLSGDPVLAEQEMALMAGLKGVAKSSDAVSKLGGRQNSCGGMNGKQ